MHHRRNGKLCRCELISHEKATVSNLQWSTEGETTVPLMKGEGRLRVLTFCHLNLPTLIVSSCSFPYYLPTFLVLINEYVAGHVKGLCFPFLSSQAYSCQCGIFQHLLRCKPIIRGKARPGSQAFADSWLM